MTVSDSHCRGCPWFNYAGKSLDTGKHKGFCSFIRCVRRRGFITKKRRLSNV